MRHRKSIPRPAVEQTACYVCGGKGLVPRMYVDKYCGLKEGRALVECPQCRKNYLPKEPAKDYESGY